MPGPGKKPPALKMIAGTDRKDRMPESVVDLPLVDESPEPPNWLPNAHAVAEWNRLVPILMANKLLTEAGLMALAHMCALHGKIVQLYAAGEAPTASMSSTLRNLQNDFGLTPVAQGKVRSAGSDDSKGNKFAGNGRKQA